jgi:hypothetical protein
MTWHGPHRNHYFSFLQPPVAAGACLFAKSLLSNGCHILICFGVVGCLPEKHGYTSYMYENQSTNGQTPTSISSLQANENMYIFMIP